LRDNFKIYTNQSILLIDESNKELANIYLCLFQFSSLDMIGFYLFLLFLPSDGGRHSTARSSDLFSPNETGHLCSPPAHRRLLAATPPSALLGEAAKVVQMITARYGASGGRDGDDNVELTHVAACLESSMKGAAQLQVKGRAAECALHWYSYI
jgi:hypothetical protein